MRQNYTAFHLLGAQSVSLVSKIFKWENVCFKSTFTVKLIYLKIVFLGKEKLFLQGDTKL